MESGSDERHALLAHARELEIMARASYARARLLKRIEREFAGVLIGDGFGADDFALARGAAGRDALDLLAMASRARRRAAALRLAQDAAARQVVGAGGRTGDLATQLSISKCTAARIARRAGVRFREARA